MKQSDLLQAQQPIMLVSIRTFKAISATIPTGLKIVLQKHIMIVPRLIPTMKAIIV